MLVIIKLIYYYIETLMVNESAPAIYTIITTSGNTKFLFKIIDYFV